MEDESRAHLMFAKLAADVSALHPMRFFLINWLGGSSGQKSTVAGRRDFKRFRAPYAPRPPGFRYPDILRLWQEPVRRFCIAACSPSL